MGHPCAGDVCHCFACCAWTYPSFCLGLCCFSFAQYDGTEVSSYLALTVVCRQAHASKAKQNKTKQNKTKQNKKKKKKKPKQNTKNKTKQNSTKELESFSKCLPLNLGLKTVCLHNYLHEPLDAYKEHTICHNELELLSKFLL